MKLHSIIFTFVMPHLDTPVLHQQSGQDRFCINDCRVIGCEKLELKFKLHIN